MSIITDYDTLSTAVENYLGREDLTSFTPNFIEGAENKLYRELQIRGLEDEFSAVAVSNGVLPISSIETDTSTVYRNMKFMWADGTPVKPVMFTTLEALLTRYPNRSQTSAEPRLAARQAENIIFGPVAASTVTFSGVMYQKLANLTSSGTNWFTDNVPELLLYGALLEAEPFIMNDKRLPLWNAMYNDTKKSLIELERRESRGGGTVAIQVA